MGSSGGRRGGLSPRSTYRRGATPSMNRAGALPLILAPAEVLDDAARVADRLAVDDEHGRHGLARQLAQLLALGTSPRHPLDGRLDPTPGELSRHPAARAQPVRRRLAA